jgi:hypothetical protein
MLYRGYPLSSERDTHRGRRGDESSRAPAALGVIRQVVYRGIALGRRGVYGYSINTELRSQGATPRRTPRIGVFYTNVRNQDKDYAGYPQAHRASLCTVALTEYASRDVFFEDF